MKAVIFREPGSVAVADVAKPEIQGPQDAIIKVTVAGICGSDLHIMHGDLLVEPGTIIGHELTGVVVEVGSGVTGFKPGDRVLAAAGVWCGRCEACRRQTPMACEHAGIYGCGPLLGDLPGTQAEYALVRFADQTLYHIPQGLTDEAVLFAGDILSTAYMAAEGITSDSRGIQPSDRVAIFGAGPVGLCAVASAKLFNPASIMVVDRVPYRLKAASQMGADVVINLDEEDPVGKIFALTESWGAEYVIETVGSPAAFADCIGAAACGGTVAIVGVYSEPVELPIHLYLLKGLGITMSLVTMQHVPHLLKLIEEGTLDLTPLITHKLPLAEAAKGYQIFDQKEDGAIKVLLYP